jgi:teichuronic acid biosynthesis glycosyltransferase TuaH
MTNPKEVFLPQIGNLAGLGSNFYKKILFLSHTHMGGVYRVGSHHLAEAAAEFGDTVLHISTPITFLHRFKQLDVDLSHRFANAKKLLSVNPRILSYIPRSVLPLQKMTKYRTHSWPILGMRKTVGIIKIFDPDIVLIDQRTFQPLLPLIYDPLLNKPSFFFRGTDIAKSSEEKYSELKILDHASGVVGTSSKILANIDSTHRKLLLNNGVDRRFLIDNNHISDRDNIIYVGALDERFDWDAISVIARIVPKMKIDIFGTGSVPNNLAANVQYKGSVNYEELPRILRKYKFGLLPFNMTSDNHGRSPMKLWEYLASGLIVIASAAEEIVNIGSPNTIIYRDLHELSKILNVDNLNNLYNNFNLHGMNRTILENELWEVKYSLLRSFMLSSF